MILVCRHCSEEYDECEPLWDPREKYSICDPCERKQSDVEGLIEEERRLRYDQAESFWKENNWGR